MIAFEIYRNGKKLCRAGRHDLAVLSAIILWAKPQAARRGATARRGAGRRAGLSLSVSGMSCVSRGTTEHPTWMDQTLRVGDTITIRIARTRQADHHARQTRLTIDEIQREQRKCYERMKRQFEPKSRSR